MRFIRFLLLTALLFPACRDEQASSRSPLQRLQYNNPGLSVDLGVGLWAWPLPMDFDRDGDLDLLVSCPDVPHNGIYFFENTQPSEKMPVFLPGVRLAGAYRNIQPSYTDSLVHLLIPGFELADFRENNFSKQQMIYPQPTIHPGHPRANQWKYLDYEGDGDLDLIVGIGDWEEYGWDNAFNSKGEWTNGPLHGYVYLIRNKGTTMKPDYEAPRQLAAAGHPIDVYGMPSPNFADFDGDGDLDLLCGEFLDKFTYFENIGSRREPVYTSGRTLTHQGKPLTMDLEMMVPVAIDWDRDGDTDLIVGQEDGRVAFIEHTGTLREGLPQFLPPVFFRQQADELKFGALVTPFSYDWDDDGDTDLICGNTAGYIGFIENLDGGDPPSWAAPRYLQADGETIRIQAGKNGSIQGPCEAKWGYTVLSVADWDQDGLADIMVNSIWGKILWYKNTGSAKQPRLAAAQAVTVDWPGKAPKPAWNWWDPQDGQLVSQWRTTPLIFDWNQDGLNDLLMLDQEGFLAFYERSRAGDQLILQPGRRVFTCRPVSVFSNRQEALNDQAGLLRLNAGEAGKSGRRKFCLTDWNLDGQPDLLVNSRNINWLRGEGVHNDHFRFVEEGILDTTALGGHSTCPTIVDWDKNQIPDLLIGAEDGFFYYLKNPNQ